MSVERAPGLDLIYAVPTYPASGASTKYSTKHEALLAAIYSRAVERPAQAYPLSRATSLRETKVRRSFCGVDGAGAGRCVFFAERDSESSLMGLVASDRRDNSSGQRPIGRKNSSSLPRSIES